MHPLRYVSAYKSFSKKRLYPCLLYGAKTESPYHNYALAPYIITFINLTKIITTHATKIDYMIRLKTVHNAMEIKFITTPNKIAKVNL